MPWLIAKPGCPVCRATVERTRRLLFWYREESYNSAPWIERLSRCWGFCRQHTWDVVTAGARHELTFGAEFLSRQAAARLGRLDAALRPDRTGGLRQTREAAVSAASVALSPEDPCPICTTLAGDARDLLDLLHSLRDRQEAEQYAVADGLCESHYARAAELATPVAPAELGLLSAAQTRSRRATLAAAGAGGVDAYGRQLSLIAGWRFGPAPQASLSRSDGAAAERESFAAHPVDRHWLKTQIPRAASFSALALMPGCPLCRLRELRRYELYTDLLAQHQGAAGSLPRLCRVHVWELFDCDDERRLPPVWSSLLESRLTEGRPAADDERPMVVPPALHCPACEANAAADAEALEKGGFNDAPAVVCLPHLVSMVQAGEPAFELAAKLAQVFAALNQEIGEYFRKLDYRFSNEPKGREQSAGLRALALLNGSPPLFRRELVESLSACGGWSYRAGTTGGSLS